jgi:transposase
LFKQRLVPANEVVLDWVKALPGPVAVTYEAGPTGFGLGPGDGSGRDPLRGRRTLEAVAPGRDRVKTDSRDAVLLARLLRLDEIVSVRVPTVSQEAARDLVRVREDVRGDLMRVRHRVSKLLLRHGHVYYGAQAWTGKHEAWLPLDPVRPARHPRGLRGGPGGGDVRRVPPGPPGCGNLNKLTPPTERGLGVTITETGHQS